MTRFTAQTDNPEVTVSIEQLSFEGLDGIEVTGTGEYRYRTIPGSVGVDLHLTLKNTSSAAISKISWQAEVKDPNGTVLEVIERVWNGYDIPFGPNEELGCRGYRSYNSETVPPVLSVQVRITQVFTTEELPPTHRPIAGEYLYQALSNSHMANIKEHPPVSADLTIDRMGARSVAHVTSENGLAEVIDAFVKIRIRNDHGAAVTDNYNSVRFTFEDGEVTGISLLLKNLTLPMRRGEVCYELDDFEPFWNLMSRLCGTREDDRFAHRRSWF